MPAESDVWESLRALSKALNQAHSAFSDAEKRIVGYENEFTVAAASSRTRLERLRGATDPIASVVLRKLNTSTADEAAKGIARIADSTRAASEAAEKLTSFAIAEVTSALQSEVAIEAISTFFVEESNLARLTELEIEHENHLRSSDWQSPGWVTKEEEFGRSFKALLQSVKGNRRRKALRSVFWPVLAGASLIISLLSQLPIVVDLTTIPFVVVALGIIVFTLPTISIEIRSGLRLHRGRVMALLLGVALVPPLVAALSGPGLIPGPNSLNSFIIAWSVFGILGWYALSGWLSGYPRELKHQIRENLLSNLDWETEFLHEPG